jgi:hypothetical protein
MTDQSSDHDVPPVRRVLGHISGGAAPGSQRDRVPPGVNKVPGKRGLRFASVGVSLAAVVVVGVLAMMVILGPSGTGGPGPLGTPGQATPAVTPSPGATPSTTPSPTPQPTPTPLAAWSGLNWSNGVAPFTPNHGGIRDIVAWRNGYVGVGWTDESGTGAKEQRAFFTSPDGLHWTTRFETIPPAGDGRYLGRVMVVGNGLLAMTTGGGLTCPPICDEPPTMAPLLWYSSDGIGWAQIQSPSWQDAWHVGSVLKVVAGPAGAVAMGYRADRIADYPGDKVPSHLTVAHSQDGKTWTVADLPSAFDHAIIRDLVAFSGGFVIVGRDGQPDPVSEVSPLPPPGVGRPAAWISTDGVTWQAARVEGNDVAGGELRQVVAGSTGLFATGADQVQNVRSGVPEGWFSPDGRSWHKIGAGFPPNASPWWTIAGDGTRMIAFGVRSSTPADFNLGAWMSTDGITWTPLASTGARTIPAGYCGAPAADEPSTCWTLTQMWVAKDGVIVQGTGSVPQLLWFATANAS